MSLQESLRLSQAESQGRAERIESLENDVSELEAKARAHETERRRLHNTIQELKVLTIAYLTAYAVFISCAPYLRWKSIQPKVSIFLI